MGSGELDDVDVPIPIVEQTCEDCLEFSPGHDGPDPAGDDCWGGSVPLDGDKEYLKEKVFEETRDASKCPYFKPGRHQ